MKATPEQQRALSQLQRSESKARRIAYQARNLDETKTLEQIIAERRALRIRQAEIGRQRDELDAKLGHEQDAATSLEEQLKVNEAKLAATGVTPKEAIALDKQDAMLKAKLDDCQSRQIELLEQAERLRNAHAIITTDEAKLAERGEQVKAKREAKLDKLRRQITELNDDRRTLASRLPRDVFAKFRQLVEENDGQAVITYVDGRVEGSSEPIGTAELERLRTAPADELVFLDYHNMMVARF